MIEGYVASEDEEAQWATERKAMMNRVCGAMSRTTAAAAPFASPHVNHDRL